MIAYVGLSFILAHYHSETFYFLAHEGSDKVFGHRDCQHGIRGQILRQNIGLTVFPAQFSKKKFHL